MIGFLLSLLVLCLIIGLVYWAISMLPLPEPIRQIVLVILVIICVIYLIGMVSGMAPPFPIFHGSRY